VKIVTLNIRQGGGQRVRAIGAALVDHDADVVVLSEYRASDAARRFASSLAEAGYRHWADGAPERRVNSVAIASRLRFDAVTHPLHDSANRHRVIEVALGPITLGAVYFPLNRVKVTFWREEFLPLAATRVVQPYCFIGDWNTGRHRIDEEGATFFGAAEFASLSASGWTDAWRSLHQDAREYSWYSHAGNGFRLDHAFLSPSLTPALRSASFSQHERLEGITDHAALVVDLDLGVPTA
jgi:exonuclease III